MSTEKLTATLIKCKFRKSKSTRTGDGDSYTAVIKDKLYVITGNMMDLCNKNRLQEVEFEQQGKLTLGKGTDKEKEVESYDAVGIIGDLDGQIALLELTTVEQKLEAFDV